MLLKRGAKTAKNKYDFIFYYKGYLFPAELKSTKQKSISFSESMIKEYQIKSLTEAANYKGVIPIFLFNFRQPKNEAFAIHISEFNKYKNIVENQLPHEYESKVNKASIPVDICKEIGIEVKYIVPRTRKHYILSKTFDELIKKYE